MITPSSDSALLSKLHQQCFKKGWSAEDIEDLLQSHSMAFIAYTSETPVGFVLFRIIADESELLSIAVLPSAQNKSFGETLLQHALKEAASAGAHIMHLEVAETNEAAYALYTKCGFTLCGKRKDYYSEEDKKVTALLMKTELSCE